MSHEVETMAYAGEVPWHGLGVQVDSSISPQEMLKVAGLEWEVVKRPNYVSFGENIFEPLGTFSLVRSDNHKVLAPSMSDGWKPVQNRTALEFFNEFCAAGNMKMETAGSLREGRNVFALARVDESFTLPGKDKVDAFLLFSNPHIVGQSVNVQFTPIRVVCANTLAMSLDEASTSRFRHFHTAEFDPEMVKEALGLAHDNMVKFKETAQFLSKKICKGDDMLEYFKRVFPAPSNDSSNTADVTAGGMSRRALLCLANVETQPGSEMSTNSWWHAFNTVTYVCDHVIGKGADTRLNNAWFGWSRARKLVAMNDALESAKAA